MLQGDAAVLIETAIFRVTGEQYRITVELTPPVKANNHSGDNPPIDHTSARHETMTQIQCPNCGGYKTDLHSKKVNQSDGSDAWGKSALGYLLYIGWFLLAGPVVALCSSLFGQQAGIVIGTGLVIIGFVVLTKRIRRHERTVKTVYFRTCQLCGYSWEPQKEQTPPNVTVRPDLIEKGNRLLEEQERRRRLLDD